jgi:hypothetical protein
MSHKPSIVRARYISTILRVARTSDAHEAKRLVIGLGSEYAHPDTPADLAPFENAAIVAIDQLSSGLASSANNQSTLWERAAAAATEWLNAAS